MKHWINFLPEVGYIKRFGDEQTDILNKIKQNLSNHYNLENNSNEYIPYNFFMFVAPVVCYELLEYKFFEEFRNNVKKIYTENNNDILTLDLPKFREYNCGLMEI